MKIATPKRVTQALAQLMKPHIGHQRMWHRRDDGQIWCSECQANIIGPEEMANSGLALLTAPQRNEVREKLARWIRANGEPTAKIFPIHRP